MWRLLALVVVLVADVRGTILNGTDNSTLAPEPVPVDVPPEPAPVDLPMEPAPVDVPQEPAPVDVPTEPAPDTSVQPAPETYPAPPTVFPPPTTSEPYLESESTFDDVIWDWFFVNETVSFIVTFDYVLWRSTDGGITWVNQNAYLSGVSTTDGPYYLSYGVANKAQVFIFSYGGDMWVTQDAGVSYTRVSIKTQGAFFYWVTPHPTNPAIAVATGLDPNCDPNFYPFCFYLFISNDYGNTWRITTTPNTPLFMYNGQYPFLSWGPSGTPGHANATLYGLFSTFKNGFLPEFYVSSNYFSSSYTQPFQTPFYGFFYQAKYDLFLMNAYTVPTALYIVPSDMSTSTQANFPIAGNAPDGLFLLDLTYGSIFIAIHRQQQPINQLELITAANFLDPFALSLPKISTDTSGKTDFFKLSSVQGIYLVNQFRTDAAGVQHLYSVMTRSNGALWDFIPPPADEACANCSLHFYGSLSNTRTAGVITDFNNVGIIIGTGMVGPYLGGIDQANVYISFDAGLTFSRFLSGNWYVKTLPASNYLIAIHNTTDVNEIKYTQDYGKTWGTITLTDQRILRLENTWTDLIESDNFLWLLCSWVPDGSTTTKYTMYLFNFTNVPAPCTTSDYEVFKTECVLGESTQKKRRIPNVNCEPDPAVLAEVQTVTCDCTRADYSCVPCFFINSKVNNENCVYQSDYVLCGSLPNPQTTQPADCPVGTNWTVPSAYMRLSTTKCVNDLALLTPSSRPCVAVAPSSDVQSPEPAPGPGQGGNSSQTQNESGAAPNPGGWIALGVILGLVIIGIGIFLLYKYVLKDKKYSPFEVEI